VEKNSIITGEKIISFWLKKSSSFNFRQIIPLPFFGSRGSEVQILSPRPFKTMGYGLDRGPFFVVGNSMGNK